MLLMISKNDYYNMLFFRVAFKKGLLIDYYVSETSFLILSTFLCVEVDTVYKDGMSTSIYCIKCELKSVDMLCNTKCW